MKRGDIVAYLPHNGDGVPYKCEIGVVKRVASDGAFVRYHTGDTAAKTPSEFLMIVENESVVPFIKDIVDKVVSEEEY